jgi:ribulose-phosphate 3-epimerase
MEIIPSVVAKNEHEAAEIQEKLAWYSGVVHIDVADGRFVPTLLAGPEIIEKMFSKYTFDVHLMTTDPIQTVRAWIGLPNVSTIIFHIEATDNVQEMVDTIHKAGKHCGVAFNLETELQFVPGADWHHVMSVHPGDYGGEFQANVVTKVLRFHQQYPSAAISVDGGINPEHAVALTHAGASRGVVGSYIIKNTNPEAAFKEFHV